MGAYTPDREFRQIDRAPWRNQAILGWISDITDGEVNTPAEAKDWWKKDATDEARIRLRSAARGVYAESAHRLNQRPPRVNLRLPRE